MFLDRVCFMFINQDTGKNVYDPSRHCLITREAEIWYHLWGALVKPFEKSEISSNYNRSSTVWRRADGVWSEWCYHTQAVSALNASSSLQFYHRFTNQSLSLLNCATSQPFPSKEVALAAREFAIEQVLVII